MHLIKKLDFCPKMTLNDALGDFWYKDFCALGDDFRFFQILVKYSISIKGRIQLQ